MNLGIIALAGAALFTPIDAVAEGEEPIVEEVAEEEEKGNVVLTEFKHGKVVASALEGEVGSVVKLTVEPGFCYKLDYLKVNETNLTPVTENSNEYEFTLIKGDNIVSANFIVDETLLKEFSTIYSEITNGDWEKLFTWQNLGTIVSWLLTSGVLIAIVRYVFKDKKNGQQVITTVEKVVSGNLPEMCKNISGEIFEQVVSPSMNEFKADIESAMIEVEKGMTTFSRCIALMQQNTPESKAAIISEIGNLNFADVKSIEEVKANLEKMYKEREEQYKARLEKLEEIAQKYSLELKEKIDAVEEKKEEKENKEEDINGISI